MCFIHSFPQRPDLVGKMTRVRSSVAEWPFDFPEREAKHETIGSGSFRDVSLPRLGRSARPRGREKAIGSKRFRSHISGWGREKTSRGGSSLYRQQSAQVEDGGRAFGVPHAV